MYPLFREVDKLRAEEHDVAKLQRDKVLKEVYRNVDRVTELRDFNDLCALEKENVKAAETARHFERRLEDDRKRNLQEIAEQEEQRKEREVLLDVALREQIRRTEPEIRELERKILEAKVSRERSIQMAHKMAISEQKRREEQDDAKKLKEQIEKEDKDILQREQMEREVKKKYHEALDQQRFIQQEANQMIQRDTMLDRILVDDIARQIKEEDEEEVRRKSEEKRKLRDQIEECERVKLEVERLEFLKRAEDEKKIADFRIMQEYRTLREEEIRMTELAAKTHMQENMMRDLDLLEQQKIRNHELRTELLYQEEQLRKGDRDNLLAERKAKMTAEAKEIYSKQMWLRAQRELLERKEEELWTKVLMDKLFEQDKLDSMNEVQKKLKQKEHRDMILKMIEDRRQRIVEDKELQMSEHRRQKEVTDLKRDLVEMVRVRIIEENASDLLGFLPKGVLKSDADVERLGESFQKFYRRSGNAEDDESPE